ncbi:MAG: DUF4254 domain-containing protein [Weeksellaceae bacterium]|nr:DUF4254 domain-containing protein [Weeksellaceae bacterium]
MKISETAWQIFNQSIEDYHKSDNVDTAMHNPHEPNTLEAMLYHKNWIDTVQWHLEDIIRDPNIAPEEALQIKRRIDNSNQKRTDLVEDIDEWFYHKFSSSTPSSEASLNTETPAWAVDRFSILALKIYHMDIEARRNEISEELKEKNQDKLHILRTQKQDLSIALDQLLNDLETGNKKMKLYKQMKMYNDKELNPVLYNK